MSKDRSILMPLTVKLRLELTEEQNLQYLDLMKQFANLRNEHVRIAMETNCFKQCKLYASTYKPLREIYPHIPSALFTAARISACNAFKVLHARQRRVAARIEWYQSRKKKIYSRLQKQYDKLMSAIPTFKETSSIPLDYGRCYDINQQNRSISLISLNKRQHIRYTTCKRNVDRLAHMQSIGESKLVYNKDNKQFYLYVAVYVLKASYHKGATIGVDQGVINPLVTSDNEKFGEDGLCKYLEKCDKVISRYQRIADDEGNRHATRQHAKRYLKQSSGRRKRFTNDWCHRTSKKFITYCLAQGISDVYMEKLLGIKSKVKWRSNGLRKTLHHWPQALLVSYIVYKAELAGIRIHFVKPTYTSLTCSKCGKRDVNGRVSRGVFLCSSCGTIDADYNAARNIQILGCFQ